MSSTETVYSAEYSDMSFGGRQTYYSFGSGDENSPEVKIAPVYFKLRDGKVFKLTDVSESMARDWSMLSPSEIARKSNIIKRKGRSGISLTSYRVALSSWFVFHEGKLVRCSIDPGSPESPLRDVQIGKTADGEFLSFPIKKKDLVRVFGEPDRIEKAVIKHAY